MPKPAVVVEIKTEGMRRLSNRIHELGEAVRLDRSEFRQSVQPILRELDQMNQQDRLRGVDREGKPLIPVTYRPKGKGQVVDGPRRAKFSARSNYGNLTTSQYRVLTGPALAPRNRQSRVVSNFGVGFEFFRGSWRLRAGWRDVLDRKGKPFLHLHFLGSGKLPKRDLGGLSRRALERLRAVAIGSIRKEIQ